MIFQDRLFSIIGKTFKGILDIHGGFIIMSPTAYLNLKAGVERAHIKEAKMDEYIEKRARYIALNYIGIKEEDLENILSSQPSNSIS